MELIKTAERIPFEIKELSLQAFLSKKFIDMYAHSHVGILRVRKLKNDCEGIKELWLLLGLKKIRKRFVKNCVLFI